MHYPILLFDADNTLFDFDRSQEQAMRQALQDVGIVMDDAMYATYCDINTRLWTALEQGRVTKEQLRIQRFQQFFEAVGHSVHVETFSEQYLGYLRRSCDLIDGALEVCQQLSERYTLVIVTNGIGDVQRTRLNGTGLAPYFHYVYISEEIGCNKPDPAFFDHVFSDMGIDDLSSVLIIGDSLTSDMAGGRNAGIDTCWFNPHGKPNNTNVVCDYEIQRIEQVLDIA